MVAFSSAGFLSSITAERQAVHEQHHVRPPRVLAFDDGELVDGEPVVVVGIVEIDDPRLRAGDRAVLAAVLDRDAIHQHPVHRAVALHSDGASSRVSLR